MKSKLNVTFNGEEGIDAGGVTREWYQVCSVVGPSQGKGPKCFTKNWPRTTT